MRWSLKASFILWIDDTALFQLTLYLRLIFLITMSDPADQIKNDVIRIDVSHTYIMTSRWTEDRNLVLVIPREILTVVLRWGDELLGGCTLVQRVGPSPLGPQTLWGTWVWHGILWTLDDGILWLSCSVGRVGLPLLGPQAFYWSWSRSPLDRHMVMTVITTATLRWEEDRPSELEGGCMLV